MFDLVELNAPTGIRTFSVYYSKTFQFQLESAIEGPFDFDKETALKEGYDYLIAPGKLTSPKYCDVALVYRLLDVGPELSEYISDNTYGWNEMIASAKKYFYKEFAPVLDDALSFERIHRVLKSHDLGFYCKDFKQICIMVSCKKALSAHRLRPRSWLI